MRYNGEKEVFGLIVIKSRFSTRF